MPLLPALGLGLGLGLAAVLGCSGKSEQVGTSPKTRPATGASSASSASASESRGGADAASESGPAPESGAAPESRAGAGAAAEWNCQPRRFAPTIDVREASGAVWVEASFGLPAHVLVVGDSGARGAFVAIDAVTGAPLARGALPLAAGATDDLEGFSRAGDDYYAVTSAGTALQYRRAGADRFRLVAAYPLTGLTCRSPRRTNCGHNLEGICLAHPVSPQPGCAGFVASKRDGTLLCLVRDTRGRLSPDHSTPPLQVAPPHALSGCDIAPGDGTLYAGTNLFGANRVFAVRDWRTVGPSTLASPTVESLGVLGPGFGEAIGAGPAGTLYRFSDLGRRPSLMARFSCRRAPR